MKYRIKVYSKNPLGVEHCEGFFAGIYKVQGESYLYYEQEEQIPPREWKTRNGVENYLSKLDRMFGHAYRFEVIEWLI